MFLVKVRIWADTDPNPDPQHWGKKAFGAILHRSDRFKDLLGFVYNSVEFYDRRGISKCLIGSAFKIFQVNESNR